MLAVYGLCALAGAAALLAMVVSLSRLAPLACGTAIWIGCGAIVLLALHHPALSGCG